MKVDLMIAVVEDGAITTTVIVVTTIIATAANNRSSGQQHGHQSGQRVQTSRNANQTFYPQQWVAPPWTWNASSWAYPPCPYRTTSWQPRPRPTAGQPGILGPRPAKAHYAASPSTNMGYSPTDIDAAMHTLALNPPDEQWYMDTGAASHMTANSGTLSSSFKKSKSDGIAVGNGHTIPILGYGHASLTQTLPKKCVTFS